MDDRYGTVSEGKSSSLLLNGGAAGTEAQAKHHHRNNTSRFPMVYVSSVAALLNIVNLGLVCSYTAPAGVRLEDSLKIRATPQEISWIASIGALSAILGGLISGFASQKIGRKAVLVLVSAPFVAGWLLIGYANSVLWIYGGRLLTGLCCGVVSVTVPTYIVEISTPDIRGMICSWFNVAFATGVLLDMTLGSMLSWSWLAVSGAFLSTAAVYSLSFVPESPYWLISKGYDERALRSIHFLRGHGSDILKEYRLIAKEIETDKKTEISFAEVLTNRLLFKPILMSVFLMFFQQFSGINALMSYTVEIFENVGTFLEPSIATIVVCCAQVVSTVVSSLLIDRVGRRPLFVLSGLFLSAGLVMLGLFNYLVQYGIISSSKYGWMAIVGFMVYLIAFSFGFGPVPWVMSPEMVPTQVRSYVVAVATLCTNLFMFIVIKTYDDLRIALHGYGIYFLYAVFCLLGCGFCLLFLPETRGKRLNEIQKFFEPEERSQKLNGEKERLLRPNDGRPSTFP